MSGSLYFDTLVLNTVNGLIVQFSIQIISSSFILKQSNQWGIQMNGSRLYVDFNELIDEDLVLLSQTDVKLDQQGNEVFLYPGKHVDIYTDDIDDNGCVDNLIASGVVELNDSGVFPVCKWNCRINENGIQHESDLKIAQKYDEE